MKTSNRGLSLITIIALFVTMASSSPLPAAQSSDRTFVSEDNEAVIVDAADFEDLDPARSAPLTDDKDDADDDEFSARDGDSEDADEDPIGDLLRGLFGFAQVGMKLVESAGKTVQRVVENEQLADTVEGLVKMGAQAIEGVARVGAAAAQAAPEVIERSSELVGGVVETAEESQPVLEKNLNQAQRVSQIAGVAIQGITNLVMENVMGFVKTFNRRLKCNTECKKKDLTELEKETCRQELCEGFNKDTFKYEGEDEGQDDEDQYGNYGGDDDEDQIQVLPRPSSV